MIPISDWLIVTSVVVKISLGYTCLYISSISIQSKRSQNFMLIKIRYPLTTFAVVISCIFSLGIINEFEKNLYIVLNFVTFLKKGKQTMLKMCILYFSLLCCCMTSNRALFVVSKLKTQIIRNCMKSTLFLSPEDRHSLFKRSEINSSLFNNTLVVVRTDISSTCSILLHVPLG